MHQKRLLDSAQEMLREVNFSDIVDMPILFQQRASLTPLEKAQVGLMLIALQPKVIVETGVWRGRTTRFLSELMTRNGINGTLYGFDFADVIEELYEIDPFFNSTSNVEFIKGPLPGSMKIWLQDNSDLKIDLALIDATHSYNAVYDELSLIAPRLSQDGYIFCHDYDVDEKSHVGVVAAIEDFCRKFDFAVMPLHSRPPAPKIDISWQSAVLRRKISITWHQRFYHWRADARERYPNFVRFLRKFRRVQ